MGEIKTVQTPKRDVAAQAALADDYLCPDAERPWARLYCAITRWIAGGSKRSVNKLAETAHVSRTAITGTMKENAKRKTDDEGLTLIAQVVGVSPAWLIKGYEHQGDCWPTWTQAWTASPRRLLTTLVLRQIYTNQICAEFVDFLPDHQRAAMSKCIPEKIYGGRNLDWSDELHSLGIQALSNWGHMVTVNELELWQSQYASIRKCTKRDQLTNLDYLLRYPQAIQEAWAIFTQRDQLSPSLATMHIGSDPRIDQLLARRTVAHRGRSTTAPTASPPSPAAPARTPRSRRPR
jgi:hypothetical protein